MLRLLSTKEIKLEIYIVIFWILLVTSFWWYQGLHALVMGSPRELKLYLVDSTGTLPSVSPLNTHKEIP